jgi:NHLM bacteriocin system ABC transporter ATP-binding protein
VSDRNEHRPTGPLPLTDANAAWLIVRGAVDLFSVAWQDNAPARTGRYLGTRASGQALFGATPLLAGRPHILMAVPTADAVLKPMERTGLASDLIDGWVTMLLAVPTAELRVPPNDVTLPNDGESTLPAGRVARPSSGVVWVTVAEGATRFLGQLPLTGSRLPLTASAWLLADKDARLSSSPTGVVLDEGSVWAGLAHLHSLVLQWSVLDEERQALADAERLEQKARGAEQVEAEGMARLASVLAADGSAAPAASAEAEAAVRLVARASGIPITWSGAGQTSDSQLPGFAGTPAPNHAAYGEVPRTLEALGIWARAVPLTGVCSRRDGGPILAFRATDRQPVALLPAGGGYTLHAPEAPPVRLTASVAAELQPIGYVFYRRLPDRPVSLWELVRLGLFGSGRDLGRLALLAVAAGLLGMLPPLLTGALFNTIIPGAQRGRLAQAAAALVAAAGVAALLELVRTYAVMRVCGRFQGALEAAVWDRLLRLPLPFFRTHTAGDLADRANSFSKFRLEFSISSVTALLGVVIACFNLVLLFFYDRALAGMVLGLLALLAAFTIGSTWLLNHYARRMMAVVGSTRGLVLQLLTGLVKLRVAGAEGRAFGRWAARYADGTRAHERTARVSNAQTLSYGLFPLLTLLAVFATVLASSGSRPPIGDLLGFLAAVAAVVTSATAAVSSLAAVVKVLPALRRLQPILQAVPEAPTARQDPGPLSGALAVEHVCFGYQPDVPVLHDVSLHARPGEFIALVGPSGSGKSTLMRLLLGLEMPSSGSVTYDCRDLATLDLQAVRQQIGAMLQSARLRPGTVLENIIGSSGRTLAEAWEAARLSGLAEDLERLPLGMETVIGRDGSGLSGGQRQRLLIARVLVRRPQALLFDEATSALDNRTQALVSDSLERLHVTRVVIAHRLSTIRNADRIYVLDAGRIVESGTYSALLRQGGLFAQLAKRQMAAGDGPAE